MDDALSELLEEDEREENTNITMGLTEESTPPASSQIANMEEELKDLLMSEESEDFEEEIPLDEADELFETATARVRVNDEVSSDVGDPDNIDQALMGLFDGEPQLKQQTENDKSNNANFKMKNWTAKLKMSD